MVTAEAQSNGTFAGVLVHADNVSAGSLKKWASEKISTVVLEITGSSSPKKVSKAVRQIEQAQLQTGYWMEIARQPELARSHPEWMASLQTHPEWRIQFPNFPQLRSNEVAKVYPWVPVLYRETYPVHLARVQKQLHPLPQPKFLFLNDLQGAPSACGCGNTFCRWTTDYGPIKTATRLPNRAAADFVEAVSKLNPSTTVVPVWTTECAKEDADHEQGCAGVKCFGGACWREYSKQLGPIASSSSVIGVLLPFQDFQRNVTQGPRWQKSALESFQKVIPTHGLAPLLPNRLLAVIDGYQRSPREIKTQVDQARELGTGSYLLSLIRIDQSWEPRAYLPKTRGP